MNGGFVHLLAKSTATPDQPQEHEKLDGHILGVLNAARTLLQLVGNQFVASLTLSSEWYNVIDAAVARGALLHDLGKANDQFQRLVRGDKTIQALRHEWVSLDILLQYSVLDSADEIRVGHQPQRSWASRCRPACSPASTR